MGITSLDIVQSNYSRVSERLRDTCALAEDIKDQSFLRLDKINALVDTHFPFVSPENQRSLDAAYRHGITHHMGQQAYMLLVFLSLEAERPTFNHLKHIYNENAAEDEKTSSMISDPKFHEIMVAHLIKDYKDIDTTLLELGAPEKAHRDEYARIMRGLQASMSQFDTSRRLATANDFARSEFVCGGYAELAMATVHIAEINLAFNYLRYMSNDTRTETLNPVERSLYDKRVKSLHGREIDLPTQKKFIKEAKQGTLVGTARRVLKDIKKAEGFLYKSVYTYGHMGAHRTKQTANNKI